MYKQIIGLFKDKNGKFAIAQWPNKPLWIAIILWGVADLSIPFVQPLSKILVIPVMLYWSYLEVFFGDSSFRKLLGILVALNNINNLLFIIASFS